MTEHLIRIQDDQGDVYFPETKTSIVTDDMGRSLDEIISALTGVGGGCTSAILLPISANDVSETSQRQFIDGPLKSQITANSGDIASFGQRLAELESASTPADSGGKAQMTADSDALYVAELLDGITLQNVNGQIKAVGMDGVAALNSEINALVGIRDNVQSQIDGMTSLMQAEQVVNTEKELPPIADIGKTVLVREDSTQNGATTFYRSDGLDWVYVNRIDSGLARDFTKQPIALHSEVDGMLAKTRYEMPVASDIAFTDANGNIQAQNVASALQFLFTLADNGKRGIAKATGAPLSASDSFVDMAAKIEQLKTLLLGFLDAKGVIAYPYNTLFELINKVMAIPNVSVAAGLERITKLNVQAPYTYKVVLKEPLEAADIAASLIEFVPGAQGVAHYDVKFNNGDAANFIANYNLLFDGIMRINPNIMRDMIVDAAYDVGRLYRQSVVRSEYKSVDGITISPVNASTKTLFYHNGVYKRLNGDFFEDLSETLPVASDFIAHGTTVVSPALDRQVKDVAPIVVADKTEIGEGFIFSTTLDFDLFNGIKRMEVVV